MPVRTLLIYCLSVILGSLALTPPASYAAISSPNSDLTVASIEPPSGQIVGVGYPVIIHFTHPIVNHIQAQNAIHIWSSIPKQGRFEWIAPDTVQWIPDNYWAPHSKIRIHISGLSTGFETGDAIVGIAHLADHTFTVTKNDEILRVMTASMGKPKRPTPLGSFTALSKERTIKFDSRTIGIPLNDPEGYLIDGQWAVRVTWSGVYVHSAPWSVNSQGYSNVSHGCINLSPENAEWYFNLVKIGDPILIRA